MFTRKSISLIAVLAAMGVLGVSATSAWATRLVPAGTAITASSASADFIPENAFSPAYVHCTTNTAKATTPTQVEPATQNNTNRTGTGTFSGGRGSVTMDTTEPPTFENCGVFERENPGEVGEETLPASIATNQTNGKWSLAALHVSSTSNIIAIGVPKGGLVYTIAGVCPFTLSPEQASVVTADWTNGTNSTTNPSSFKVDGQIRFSDVGGCSGFNTANPWQFEGTYQVRTNPEGATPVVIEE